MIFIVLAGLIFTADILIKNYIEKNKDRSCEEKIAKGIIIVRKYHNKGVFLNLFQKKKKYVLVMTSAIFGIIAGVFLTSLPKKGQSVMKTGLAMILGGAASNLYDRVRRGYVVDYFSFKWLRKIVWNLGDMFIILGGIVTVLSDLHKGKR